MALDVRSFESLRSRFGARSSLKLANNTYGRVEGEFISIKYHATEIATLRPESAVLNSGGWLTSTTKVRLNEIAGAYGWRLDQEKGAWLMVKAGNWENDPSRAGEKYMAWNWSKSAKAYEFKDNVRIFADGRILGAGEDQTAKRKLAKRQIKKFAGDYMTALFALQVAAPSAGDCFYCQMSPLMRGTGHIQSHIDEGYFVPSLLVKAIADFPVSKIASAVLAEIWSAVPSDEQKERWSKTELEGNQHAGVIALSNKLGDNLQGIAKDQLQKSPARYMARALGIAG